MKLIAHRGLYQGPDQHKENHPEQIKKAMALGFDCEIDLWLVKGKAYLGHDAPEYPIDLEFLLSTPLWIHAKNLDALHHLATGSHGVKYFWHQQDDFTLTSNGYIWTYPGKTLTAHSIAVMPEWRDPEFKYIPHQCYGICSDFVETIQRISDKSSRD